ncbi:aspartyl-phosphate phosphatase Spo0E family protein [Sutcliffiella deserti]|uniref:aspartyl-phosphate phosphatase Spo0E family protein n=1 Tax=Sutcliffiella deserti TaxID=2875501 RepID=UPI001CBE7421|nr:aspartyl-phosphate phosphatase Spo0E family protein [Sutcliffiella deserti]
MATKQEILQLIEKKRTELIDIVANYGMSSTKTLKVSQELDILLNKYNQLIVPKYKADSDMYI